RPRAAGGTSAPHARATRSRALLLRDRLALTVLTRHGPRVAAFGVEGARLPHPFARDAAAVDANPLVATPRATLEASTARAAPGARRWRGCALRERPEAAHVGLVLLSLQEEARVTRVRRPGGLVDRRDPEALLGVVRGARKHVPPITHARENDP